MCSACDLVLSRRLRTGLRKRLATIAQPVLLGAAVRVRRGEATGVVIGKPADTDRVRVRWDDTDEVTDCLRANLIPAVR
jgi:hypothetical protein